MDRFADFLENTRVKSLLQGAIRQERISHAYLFLGERGLGKYTLARTFAKTLQCEAGQTDACDTCPSCHAFDHRNHPDILFVTREKSKTLGVSEIREQITAQTDIKPYRFRYKIYILPEADRMTPQAQNAFLKTLEEPPAHAIFLLLAESVRPLLPTLLSRCVQVKLQPLLQDTVHTALNAEAEDTASAKVAAAHAQGSLGRGREILHSPELLSMFEEVRELLTGLSGLDAVSAMLLAKNLEKYKDTSQFLEAMTLWYRDVLAAKATGNTASLLQTHEADALFLHAKKESFPSLLQKLSAITSARTRLAQNANYQLTMEVLLMTLKESSNR